MAPVPYATVEDVRKLIARSAESRPGTGASIGEAQILEAISSAQQQVDSALGLVYPVPFGQGSSAVPPMITDITTALAAYELDLIFREVRDYVSELNPILLRRKDAQDRLEAIRTGRAAIPGYVPGGEPGPESPNDGGAIVEVVNPDPCCEVSWKPTWGDQFYGRWP